MSEHQEQASFFQWAHLLESRHPELGLMFAIPNGGKRKSGWWEKAEGLKAGVPDIFLAVPRDFGGCFCPGLFIEMKFGKNKLTTTQKEWHHKLYGQGYAVRVCYSWVEARDIAIDYLGLEDSLKS